MTDAPTLSVVIAWANRPELAKSLKANRAQFNTHHVELIVVNCGGDSALIRNILAEHAPDRAILVDLPQVAFNKSFALNHGAAVAKGSLLFQLDADVVLQADFLEQALAAYEPDQFITVDRVLESRRGAVKAPAYLRTLTHSVTFEGNDGRKVTLDTNRIDLADGSRSAPGLILLGREQFLAVDGMNAGLEGWGWEDLDLLVRLQFELGLRHQRVGTVTHMSHGDNIRDTRGTSRARTEANNFNQCLAAYSLGYFLGSYEEDLEEAQATVETIRP